MPDMGCHCAGTPIHARHDVNITRGRPVYYRRSSGRQGDGEQENEIRSVHADTSCSSFGSWIFESSNFVSNKRARNWQKWLENSRQRLYFTIPRGGVILFAGKTPSMRFVLDSTWSIRQINGYSSANRISGIWLWGRICPYCMFVVKLFLVFDELYNNFK